MPWPPRTYFGGFTWQDMMPNSGVTINSPTPSTNTTTKPVAAPSGPTIEDINAAFQQSLSAAAAQQQALMEAERQRSQESAYDLMNKVLVSWGIPVGQDILDIIRQAAVDGVTPDMIELVIPDIQKTASWQSRFPGWSTRVSNGYNQLTVGQYLDLENAYHRILQSAGLPAGFYDDPSDFGNWISNNVSPQEIQTRVSDAMSLVRQIDPTARGLLTQFYGVTNGDIASYFLDSSRALPILERQFQAVNVAAWAARNGLRLGAASHYEDLVDKGVTADMAAQGYSTVKTFSDLLGRLGHIYGIDYSQDDAELDVFFNKSDKRRRLVSNEVATFSGSSRGQLGTAQRGTSY